MKLQNTAAKRETTVSLPYIYLRGSHKCDLPRNVDHEGWRDLKGNRLLVSLSLPPEADVDADADADATHGPARPAFPRL